MDLEAVDDYDKDVREQIPDMTAAKLCFLITSGRGSDKDIQSMIEIIKEKNMAPLYKHLCSKFPKYFSLDASLYDQMELTNAKTVKDIEVAREIAEKDSGDVEVLDTLFDLSSHYARIGDAENANKIYNEILARTKISTGRRIDASMSKIRVGLFHGDTTRVKEDLITAKKLNEMGGDWDRRNRLKVYEAFYLILVRDMKAAATLFLECIATFTCYELCSYEDFIFHAVITNILSLSRTEFKKHIISGPEVLGVLPSLPHLQRLVSSFYSCNYKEFMMAMVDINEQLLSDRYMATHARYMIKELRILAYSQYLDAYRSVVLSSMANAFGVSTEFLDVELSRFIAAGRLNAQVDKVAGIVETNRPDLKNAQYQTAIKQGDLLLNKIQRLARIADV